MESLGTGIGNQLVGSRVPTREGMGNRVGRKPARFIDKETVESWRDRASCLDYDSELWFSDAPSERARAASICADCPVRQLCYGWALEARPSFGIWAAVDFATRPWIIK